MTGAEQTGSSRRRPRWVVAVAVAVAATAIASGSVIAAPPPPEPPASSGPSLFSTRRSVAIEAARTRLSLYVKDFPPDVALAEPVACPLGTPEVMADAAAATSLADNVDLRLQLDPWTATTTAEPELRPSSAAPGTVVGLPVVTCNTAPPPDTALTRPSLFAIVLRSGVTFRDVARLYGVEPALPTAASGIGGQIAGSCLASEATGVCVVLWTSSGLLFGITLAGPPGAVNPATPADLLTAAVPGVVDALAVQIGPARFCDLASIQADTQVPLVAEPVCHGGWAISSGAECVADAPCPNREVFHLESTGWEYDGSVDIGCAENLAVLGMTGTTAQQFVPACDEDASVLRFRSAGRGSVGQTTRAVQVALSALGYVLPVDGRYGPLTQAAVIDYQTRNGLTVDGIAGRETQGSLGI